MIDESRTILIINQLFEVEKKARKAHISSIARNIDRIYGEIENSGYKRIDPTGEQYSVTRTDCSANIVGEASEVMVITESLKPIIYKVYEEELLIIQKAVVLVEGR